jgi:NADPH2:quinone reductase
MRAAQISRLDGPAAVKVAEVEEPQAEPGMVVIDVHAAGVTYPDALLSRGEYQISPELPFVPGSEVAGVVRAAPEGGAVRPGDRVAAFPGFGGFAEVVGVMPQAVFPLPDRVSFAAGAALPMNYLTVHFALARRAALRLGETVLVHGAAGGIGTAAVQFARAMGARVIADFRAAVKDITGGRGVDIVVDPVGGERFTDSLRSLAPEGRLLVVGFTGGEIPTVKVNRLLLNNIAVVGVGWGAFWMSGNPDYLQEQWSELSPLVANGELDPVLGNAYPLEQADAAVAELDTRRATGKVVLRVR